MEKTCQRCDIVFTAERKERKYCSRKCQHQSMVGQKLSDETCRKMSESGLKLKVDRSCTIGALIELAAQSIDIPKHNDVTNPLDIRTLRLTRRHEVSG